VFAARLDSAQQPQHVRCRDLTNRPAADVGNTNVVSIHSALASVAAESCQPCTLNHSRPMASKVSAAASFAAWRSALGSMPTASRRRASSRLSRASLSDP
jgi:hypothetical protein